MAKRRVKRTRKKKSSNNFKNEVNTAGRRIRMSVKNLIFFALLSLASLLLEKVSTGQIYPDFFSVLTIIFACVALAFFITLIVFLLIKGFRGK